jgi:ubiquinone/menaquinone biosynthesis C-methylase UbiE
MKPTVFGDVGDAVHHQHGGFGKLGVAGAEKFATGAFQQVVTVKSGRIAGHVVVPPGMLQSSSIVAEAVARERGFAMNTDWDASAAAWIDAQGEHGDFSRRRVLDRPMVERVRAFGPQRLLDLGCGEGRFCRLLAGEVPEVAGIDPTAALIARAQGLGGAAYHLGRAEDLPFADASFDMVVSYLSLLDIEKIETALDEVTRVLRPGGVLLIANLTGFATASAIKGGGWTVRDDGTTEIVLRNYLEPHANLAEWRGIRVTNWHRPLSFYMTQLLQRGFALVYFDEPAVLDPATFKKVAFNNAPYQIMMEWRKAG